MKCDECQCDLFCCTFRVKLTFWEFLRIRLRTSKDFWEPDHEKGKMIKLKDGKCHFLNNSKCSIYSIRPKPCRDFSQDRCEESYLPWKKHQQKINKLMLKQK